ncbi:MAG TPA: DNA replication protein, partial [Hyphomonadaceae bacterium]|nr:DNA replication protein [Hyphomonadaceae bacterium]
LEPRLDRSFQAIEAFAGRLDRAMTETKRPATIPLARDVLNELIEEWETDDV